MLTICDGVGTRAVAPIPFPDQPIWGGGVRTRHNFKGLVEAVCFTSRVLRFWIRGWASVVSLVVGLSTWTSPLLSLTR